jgi:hypothetical protein
MTPATMKTLVIRYETKIKVRIRATRSASWFRSDAFSPKALAQRRQTRVNRTVNRPVIWFVQKHAVGIRTRTALSRSNRSVLRRLRGRPLRWIALRGFAGRGQTSGRPAFKSVDLADPHYTQTPRIILLRRINSRMLPP